MQDDKDLFFKLTSQQQLSVAKKVERYTHVYFVASNPTELCDHKKMIKLFLAMNGLNAPSDFDSHLVPGTVEEIYDIDMVQEYGNLEFLRLCNYPLLKIFLLPFPTLYFRDDSITKQLLDHCLKVVAEGAGFTRFTTSKHLMRELSSEKKIFFEIEHLGVTSLSDDDGKVTHFFCNQWARVAEVNSNVQIIH